MIKHREQILYLFFGILTTVVNLLIFYVFYTVLEQSVFFSNSIAWVLSVLFAFVTNRVFVFKSEVRGFVGVIKECTKFFGGRLASLALESFLLWLMIDSFELPVNPVKVITTVIVVLANYFISKFFVFLKR